MDADDESSHLQEQVNLSIVEEEEDLIHHDDQDDIREEEAEEETNRDHGRNGDNIQLQFLPILQPGLFGIFRLIVIDILLLAGTEQDEEHLRVLEEEENRLILQTQRKIETTLKEYKDAGVPDSDVVFIEASTYPVENIDVDHWRVTLKRIILAVLLVLTVVTFAVLHSFPVFEIKLSPSIEAKKMYPAMFNDAFDFRYIESPKNNIQEIGCNSNIKSKYNQGVIHLKSVDKLHKNLEENRKKLSETGLRGNIFENGLDHSWFGDCTMSKHAHQSGERLCFRGVHDNLIEDTELYKLLNIGMFLIENGGRYSQIYNNTDFLLENAGSVYEKIYALLTTRYNLKNACFFL